VQQLTKVSHRYATRESPTISPRKKVKKRKRGQLAERSGKKLGGSRVSNLQRGKSGGRTGEKPRPSRR